MRFVGEARRALTREKAAYARSRSAYWYGIADRRWLQGMPGYDDAARLGAEWFELALYLETLSHRLVLTERQWRFVQDS